MAERPPSLESPLLGKRSSMRGLDGDYKAVSSIAEAKGVFVEESRKLWRISVPVIFNMLCCYGINTSTQIFIGHVGALELSAVAIGVSVVSTFSFGFLLGMGSALETLCGQAYGAGQVHMLGVYMQRSFIILFCSSCILCPIYFFATPILVLIGQDPDIARLAGRFTAAVFPQLFALAIFFPTQKFLQAQSKVLVMAWIGLAALILHVCLLSLFISKLHMGVYGAALAFSCSWWFISLAQLGYIVGWCKVGWRGLSWAAFHDIWAFVRLSLASAVMLCLELWYMMILVALTGGLHHAEIAVASIAICMDINGMEMMIFIGINAAVSVRVSNELGAGCPRATKYAVVVTVATALAMGLVFMAAILISRDYFAIIYTDDAELRRAVAKVAYLLGATMLVNSVQPTISGVAVGGGWQALVAYINLGCYYLFGLPLGFLLGYVFHLGVEGIWSGLLCGTVAQTLSLVIVVWKTNWNEEAEKASERVKRWGGQGKESAEID